MPFIFVWGLPEKVTDEAIIELRDTIVSKLAENMNIDQSWIRVFFPQDLLSRVTSGNSTIYVTIETGMFFAKNEDDPPNSATTLVAQIIWEMLDGQYEVECFVGNHNPKWVTLIHAKP
jgi:hypothetical protein